MVVKTITEAKNSLSALIDQVRAGESVLILDRGIPVARLESAVRDDGDAAGRLARLQRAGLIEVRGGVVPDAVFAGPVLDLGDAALSDAVIDERRTGW